MQCTCSANWFCDLAYGDRRGLEILRKFPRSTKIFRGRMDAGSLMWLQTVVLFLVAGTRAEDIDVDISVDRSNWKDPLDPLTSSYVHSHAHSCHDELRSCREALDVSKEKSTLVAESKQTVDPTLKHVIRAFLARLSVDIDKVSHVNRPAMVYLSVESVAVLRRFLNAKEVTATLREQVRVVLEDFILQQDPFLEPTFTERVADAIVPVLPFLNTVVLLPAIIVLARARLYPRYIISLVLCTAFVVSCYTAWNRKYLESVAARMERSATSMDEACKPKSLWGEAAAIAKGLFFIKGKSECQKRYEDLIVSPIYEVSPLDILAEVIASGVFTPLGVLARHFNIFTNEFYRDSPPWLNSVKTILFVFLVLVGFFYLSGYRIRTLFATLEPSERAAPIPSLPSRSAPALTEMPTSEVEEHRGGTPLQLPGPSSSTSCRSRTHVRMLPDNDRRAKSSTRMLSF